VLAVARQKGVLEALVRAAWFREK